MSRRSPHSRLAGTHPVCVRHGVREGTRTPGGGGVAPVGPGPGDPPKGSATVSVSPCTLEVDVGMGLSVVPTGGPRVWGEHLRGQGVDVQRGVRHAGP